MRAASLLWLMWLPLAAALAENPPDVTFSIATKNGRTTFQMGEAVDVQLSFRSTAPGKYRLITAPDDRTVRIPRYDQFTVEPREGVADPLGDIPAQMDGMLVKGSLQQWPFLSSNAAAIVEQPVNLWVSFRKPGRYRITAETKRVVTAGQPSAPLSLRSNSIEVEIVEPEPGWRAAQLSAAVATLARGDPRVVMGQPYDERGTADLKQAGRVVRFLETVEAVPVLARLFEDGPRNAQGDIRAGLFGSPYRKQVITAMEQAVESPDRPVTYYYLATLMELAAAETFGPQPRHPVNDPAAEKSWMEAHQRYLDQSKPVETHYFDMLAGAIPRKQGRALAVSLETLLTRGPQPPSPSTLALLIQSFQALPEMDQRGLLTVNWFRLASPAVEPFVRSLAEGTGLARDAALLRLLDFNPAAARNVAIERIRRCDTGGGVNDNMRALLSLPDKTLPELDSALIEALEQGKPAEVLVARYATEAILSRVRAWYEQGPKPRGRPLCGGPIFAYFFRVDPAYAADRLASSRRSGDACPLYMPQDEDLLMSPGLERAAINDLANPSTTVQRGAETILEKGGSRDAEQPLWEGLARARETGGGTPGWEAEFGFMDALINGNGWALTPEKLDRLAVGCVSAGCRSLVTSLRRVVEPPIQISFGEVACGSCPIRVGSSRAGSLKKLEDKISQFPRGTQFRVYPFRRGTWFGDQLTSQVRSIVQAAGMTLEETPATR